MKLTAGKEEEVVERGKGELSDLYSAAQGPLPAGGLPSGSSSTGACR